MELNHDALVARWQQIEARLNQISIAPGLDLERCHAEVERLLAEVDQIECALGFNPSINPDSRGWPA
jgi:hypothetical protein